MDNNYWKNAYQNTCDQSSEREKFMVDWIKKNTGLKAEVIGLGAGTSDFIDGSATQNGHEKGDADLHIVDTNIYIEVTGPLTKSVPVYSPLWFRPDKFENAIRNRAKGHDTFFAHHCPSGDLWRIIHVDDNLVQRYQRGAFRVVTPRIRGRQETYVEIPSNDKSIQPLGYLKNYLIDETI